MTQSLRNCLTSLFKTKKEVAVDPHRSGIMRYPESLGVKRVINENLYDFGSCGEGKEKVVLIFFHGLELDDNASAADTWWKTWTFRDHDKEKNWPQELFSKDKTSESESYAVRVFVTKYDASKYKTDTTGRLDLYLVAENFVQIVIEPIMRVVQSSIPIVLVAHSFGGIVIQEMIKHAFNRARKGSERHQKFLTCLGGIFFYATPHGSLVQATFDHIFLEKDRPIASTGDMLTQHNRHLIRSREEFNRNLPAISRGYRNQKKIKTKSVFEIWTTTLRGKAVLVMTEAAADVGGADGIFIEDDHLGICKPSNADDGLTDNKYVFLRSFITDVLELQRVG